MTEEKLYPIFPEISERAHISETQYLAEYDKSVNDSEQYWSDIAKKFITWDQSWTTVSDVNFETADIKWFVGAKLNVSKKSPPCVTENIPFLTLNEVNPITSL